MGSLMTRARPARWPVAAAIATFAMSGVAGRAAQDGPITFRSSVDLVAVDVQVVDPQGMPVTNLSPEQFEVSIDRQPRRVVSVEFIEHVPPSVVSTRTRVRGPLARNFLPGEAPTGPARLFMIAVDVLSFSASASRGAMAAARHFVAGLEPHDLVGVYAYPLGPKLNPTTDHAEVDAALSEIIGQRQLPYSRFNLTPAEVIDITAEMSRMATPIQTFEDTEETVAEVAVRECGRNSRCSSAVRAEATALANYYEAKATQGLNSLALLIDAMGAYPGRKTVILISAGMATSDRPGGRPDVTNQARRLGRAAAAGNTTLYLLHVDNSYIDAFSAEVSQYDIKEMDRESSMVARWLNEFSGASGAALLPVLVGSGGTAFDRVLRETSAFYLLGVEPEASDRTGEPKVLNVKVNGLDATVRSRTLVVIPPVPAS